MQQRFAELRDIQTQPVDRCRHQQIQNLGEKEARQRRNDVRQHQDGNEGQQNEAENLAGDQRAQFFDAAQRFQDPIQHAEHADPEAASHQCENDELAGPALRALFTHALERGAPFWGEHVRQRRLFHLPRTSASSRTCAPPVSLRNNSSRLASPALCWRRTSATVPAATILPCWMMAIWSHIASATSSVCVLIRTVPPFPTNCRKMSFSKRAAFGSRPTIGSSTTMHPGRCI